MARPRVIYGFVENVMFGFRICLFVAEVNGHVLCVHGLGRVPGRAVRIQIKSQHFFSGVIRAYRARSNYGESRRRGV